MGVGMLRKLRIVGTAMRCFGLVAAADLKCGRLMIQATIESHVTAHLWQHENTFGVDLNGDGIDSGNNNIYGSIGNDTFDGGAGDDIING